jgi:hypothetical protein
MSAAGRFCELVYPSVYFTPLDRFFETRVREASMLHGSRSAPGMSERAEALDTRRDGYGRT